MMTLFLKKKKNLHLQICIISLCLEFSYNFHVFQIKFIQALDKQKKQKQRRSQTKFQMTRKRISATKIPPSDASSMKRPSNGAAELQPSSRGDVADGINEARIRKIPKTPQHRPPSNNGKLAFVEDFEE